MCKRMGRGVGGWGKEGLIWVVSELACMFFIFEYPGPNSANSRSAIDSG